jgi:hypothetical protein
MANPSSVGVGGNLILMSGDGYTTATPGSSIIHQIGPNVHSTLSGTSTTALFTFPAAVAATIQQTAPTTDVAVNNLTIQSQAPYASATNNARAGSIILNIPASVDGYSAGGPNPFVQVQYNGTQAIGLGYGNGGSAPSVFFGSGESNNISSNGSTAFNFSLSGSTYYTLSTTTFTLSAANPVIACAAGAGSLTLNAADVSHYIKFGTTGAAFTNISGGVSTGAIAAIQFTNVNSFPGMYSVPQTSDATVYGMVVSAMNAFATATSHITGANCTIAAGNGATSNPSSVGVGGNLILMSGDGYTAATPGSQIQLLVGPNNLLTLSGTSTSALLQTPQATSDVALAPLTISSQSAFTTATSNINGASLTISAGNSATSNPSSLGTGGNLFLNGGDGYSGAGTASNSGYVIFQSGGSTIGSIQPEVSAPTNFDLYLTGTTSPSAGNPALSCTSTTTVLNGSTSVYVQINRATTYMQFTSSSIINSIANNYWTRTLSSPLLYHQGQTTDVATTNLTITAQNAYASATSHTTGGNLILSSGAAATGSTAYSPGALQLQAGGVTCLQVDGYGLHFTPQSIALTTGTTILTMAQATASYIKFTGSLTGNCTTIFPYSSTAGQMWYVDTTAVVFDGYSITLQINGNSTLTSSITSNSIYQVIYNGTQFYITQIAIGAGLTTTLTGDVTGTTTASVVSSISGSSPIVITPANLQFKNTTSAPTISQNSTSTTSATGQTLTIQAQNATGSTSTGGAVAITPGTGTSVGGFIELNGGQVVNLTTIGSAPYTYHVDGYFTTSDYAIAANTTNGAVTIILPVPTAGRMLRFKDWKGTAATHNIIIQQHASETIDGAIQYVIAVNYASVTLIADGTNWGVW